MPGVAYSWDDEPSERPHDGQAWSVHGTRGEREEEGLVGHRIAAEDAVHGLVAQSRHKKPSDAMSHAGSLGSWEPYPEGTRSSQSAGEWTEARHHPSLRSNRPGYRWGSSLVGAIDAGA